MFERILAIEPRYWDALARIANARRIERPGDPLFETLRDAVASTADEPEAREGLLFALGKAFDDVGSCSRTRLTGRTSAPTTSCTSP